MRQLRGWGRRRGTASPTASRRQRSRSTPAPRRTSWRRWCASPTHTNSPRRLGLFLNFELVQNIEGEFAHEIVTAANSSLGQYVKASASPHIVFPREPVAVQRTRDKGPSLRWNLV